MRWHGCCIIKCIVKNASDNLNQAASQPQIIEVGDANFESEVLKSKQPVVVAFGAPWSQPCQIFVAVLKEVAALRANRVKVVKINADDNPDFSLTYEVQSIPTLLYFWNGNLLGRTVGTASKEAILSKLEALFRNDVSQTADTNPRPDNAVQKPAPGPMGSLRYSARRNLHRVTFFCQASDATQVFLIGDFNQWKPTANPMQRMPDGFWTTQLELSHGYHQYLFLVDGKPVLDPKATGNARNAQDEPVSLIAVS